MGEDSVSQSEWHLARGGKQHGPITGRQLLLLAEQGKLQPDDLLWKRGFDDWKAASSIPGLLNPPASCGEKPSVSQPGPQKADAIPAPVQNMRGKVLFYDNATANGIIGGDDGRRYAFQRDSVGNSHEMLRSGQEVDFEISENQAANIYVVRGGLGQVGKKSKVAAGLLGILLGGIGIHKFYIGASGAGYIMLVTWLFGWVIAGIPTAIMSIIGIIEGIMYLTQSEKIFIGLTRLAKKRGSKFLQLIAPAQRRSSGRLAHVIP